MPRPTKIEPTEALLDRFYAKVRIVDDPPDVCYEWIGAKDDSGYGHMFLGIGTTLNLHAHAIAWMLDGRELPLDRILLHKCDNPACVRLDHLVLGTYSDNTVDMYAKDRKERPKGEKNPMSKLTAAQVADIKAYIALGVRKTRIANRYNVNALAIYSIASGKNWADVQPATEVPPWEEGG